MKTVVLFLRILPLVLLAVGGGVLSGTPTQASALPIALAALALAAAATLSLLAVRRR